MMMLKIRGLVFTGALENVLHIIQTERVTSKLTCEGVASLIPEVPDGLQEWLSGGEVIKVPLCAWISAVLRQC